MSPDFLKLPPEDFDTLPEGLLVAVAFATSVVLGCSVWDCPALVGWAAGAGSFESPPHAASIPTSDIAMAATSKNLGLIVPPGSFL
jgi:hypothetical protein